MAEIYYILLYYLYAVSLLNIKEIRKLTTPTPWPGWSADNCQILNTLFSTRAQ